MHRTRQVALNQLCRQPQHGKAQALELGIPASIRRTTAPVRCAINLYDELELIGDEVANAAVADSDLTAKLDSECRAADSSPYCTEHARERSDGGNDVVGEPANVARSNCNGFRHRDCDVQCTDTQFPSIARGSMTRRDSCCGCIRLVLTDLHAESSSPRWRLHENRRRAEQTKTQL
jgi:hypothetical protein